MSKNVLIGLLVVAVVIVGGILIVNMNGSNSYAPTATSTTPGATGTNGAPAANMQASAPNVSTDNSTTASNSTVVLAGKVTPNGAQTSYWYEYGKSSSLGIRTNTQAIGSGFVAINAPVYITGLAANTNYYYRLIAQNAFGTVTGATNSFATNSNPPPQGNAPAAQTNGVTNISQTGASINGTVNPSGAQTSYWFEYGESANLGSVSGFQSAGGGTASVNVSVPLANLKPLTKYFFRLNAQNQFGTVNGATLNFTTQGPATNPAGPGEPAATTNGASNVSRTSATLNGRVNPDGAATTYWFEYSLNSNLSAILGSTSHASVAGTGVATVPVSARVSGLLANTPYFYRLVAQNSVGTVDGAIMSFQTTR